MESIDALSKKLSEYLTGSQIEQVNSAYEFANNAHSGQFRKSGDPYVSHPVAVANILSNLRLDEDSISAAMLHDVIEDCGVPKQVIEKEFNSSVANLVDGVSKLDKLQLSSTSVSQAQNYQKMILAMAKDIRVIVVKLADRLHNMRTLGHLDREKQIIISKETLEIYAPIAHRIGMNNIYRELEDLSFRILYPTRYRRLRVAVKKNRGSQKRLLKKIQRNLEKQLVEENIAAYIEGRDKHIYSIYRKMKQNRRSFNEIMDIYAFKLIVDKPDDCYRALGAVHSVFKPIEGRFKDYIAIPKSNGYQSIHTGVIGTDGQPIEIQIKTEEMDDMAENGIASHWLYKSGNLKETAPQRKARKWVAGLVEMRNNYENSEEYIDSIKTNIFPDEIYVFTPQGKILELPEGSTAIDFAYSVHTDIGNYCKGCRINRRLAPLSVPLESGQTVEILTDKLPQTSPAWLDFTATSRARNSIRHYLSNIKITEAVKVGKKILEQSLAVHNIKMTRRNNDHLLKAAKKLGVDSLDDLLEEIGLGKRAGNIVATQISNLLNKSENVTSLPIALEISGTEGLTIKYGQCCNPIPGDSVIGHFTSGGMVVHQERCKNILSVREDPKQCFPVKWDEKLEKAFPTEIKVIAEDYPGLLADVAFTISSNDTNIESFEHNDLDSGQVSFHLFIQVYNRDHLAKLVRKLRSMKRVISVNRIHDQEDRDAKTLH
tara:strand:- start:4076 stop:6214 length:2139 start_codon:yes stop_codon:yes gene_type:complete